MKKSILMTVVLIAGVSVYAQSSVTGASMVRQAMQEMQRVSGQIDILQANHDDLASKIGQLESQKSEFNRLKSEVAAMNEAITQLKLQMESMRSDIIKELSGKLKTIQDQVNASADTRARSTASVSSGPVCEHVVESGDTLWLISQAFTTTPQKIKELNNLKSDRLRIGQKLIVPAPKNK